MIKKCLIKDMDPDRPKSEQVWCLYTQDGSRVLGRHKTKKRALLQERAIQVRKHMGDLMALSDFYKVGPKGTSTFITEDERSFLVVQAWDEQDGAYHEVVFEIDEHGHYNHLAFLFNVDKRDAEVILDDVLSHGLAYE